MSRPHGSIPGYRPGPILSSGRKAFLASLVIAPAACYVYIRRMTKEHKEDQRLLEEEGRQNWIQSERAKVTGRDLSAPVRKSGGGV